MEPTPKTIDAEFVPPPQGPMMLAMKGPDQEFWEQVFTTALSMMEVAAEAETYAHDCATLADACLTEWRKRWQKSAYEKQQAMPSTEPEGDITA